MVGIVEKDGKIFLNSLKFSKAWNSLGKDIPIKQGNAFPLGQGDAFPLGQGDAFPLGQGDVLDIDTGVSASFPDDTVGMVMMPSLW